MEKKKFMDLTLNELFINFKLNINDIFVDILDFKYNNIYQFINIFTINDRLFYI